MPADTVDAESTVILGDLTTNYYNNYSQIDNVDIADEDYYVKVIDNISGVTSVTVGGQTYTTTDVANLSIGSNSWIKKPFFLNKENGLYLIPPMIYALSDNTNKLNITVTTSSGSADYTVQLSDASQEMLTIDDVVAKGGKSGYTNTVSTEVDGNGYLTITHNRQDGTAYLAMNVYNKTSGTKITDGVFFACHTNKATGKTNYSMTELEKDGTYAIYSYYKNAAFSNEEGSQPTSRELTVSLTLNDSAKVKFDIHTVETIKE